MDGDSTAIGRSLREVRRSLRRRGWSRPLPWVAALLLATVGLLPSGAGFATGSDRGAILPPDGPAVRRAMLATYIHGVDDALALRLLGRGAVPALRRLLPDPEFPRRDNVVAFLAHLDEGAATRDLMRLMADPPAVPTVPAEDRALLLAPVALGRIAARGDPAALEALLRITGPGPEFLDDAVTAGRISPGRARDLRRMALHGLLLAGSEPARDRLAAVAAEEVLPGGLEGLAAKARDLLEDLDRGPKAEAADAMAEVRPVDGALPRYGPELPTGGTGLPAPPPVPEILDTGAWVHDAGIDYANHPDVPSPMTDAVLDANLAHVSRLAGRADFPEDVACCNTLSRSGTQQTFGAAGDGNDVIETNRDQNKVLGNNTARVKVVRLILYCSGPTTNAIGCGWVGYEGVAVVRASAPDDDEGVLWMHEYGHNTGLPHNPDPRYIMYSVNLGTNDAVTELECAKYHNPNPGSNSVLTTTGDCLDTDLDDVHDGVDNCATEPNFSQDDLDGDGEGDACDADDDGDGDGDGTDCEPQDPLIFTGAAEIGCNGIDENCNGLADDTSVDADGDTVGCGADPFDGDPLVCGIDLDADGCDDCAGGSGPDIATDGPDADADGRCDAGDLDDDGDGYPDVDETTLCVPPSDPLDPLSTPADQDADGICDTLDYPDDDEDGYSNDDELTNCIPSSDPLDPLSVPVDTDGDLRCDTVDLDDDGDGDPDATDCAPLDPAIFSGAVELACNGIDENCSGPADDTTVDGDGDTVGCDSDPDDGNALVCGLDVDADTCDDCAAGTGPDPLTDGSDLDGDGLCDAGDPDDDGDGDPDATDCAPLDPAIFAGAVELGCNGIDENCNGLADDTGVDADGDTVACDADPDDLDPLICGLDSDQDGCDDCAGGAGPDPATDGLDSDGDSVCDSADPDDDNDGDPDLTDCAPLDPAIFTGATELGCNGIDENCSGPADDVLDADGDTVDCTSDADDGDPLFCGQDLDADTCDDCAGGSGPDPANDGDDLDADGLCDAGDPDDDFDGYTDVDETTNCVPASDPRDPLSRPLDTDLDGDCDTLDLDDDGDGDPDATDCQPLDAAIFTGATELGCNGIDENCNGPGDDVLDADGDTVDCSADLDDGDPLVCGVDADADGCDDCAAGAGPDPSADGTDTDGDGLCDAGDPDDDGDGDPDGTDCAPQDPLIFTGAAEIGCNGIDENCNGPADDLVDGDADTVDCLADADDANPLVCRDVDADGCDDCSLGAGADPASDGPDLDADGLCDAGDPDDDGDGYSDADEAVNCTPPSDPLDALSVPVDTDGDGQCDTIDTDDDGDGYADLDETVNCSPPSDPLDPLSTPVDLDGDLLCDTLDPDDDGDGDPDGTDCAPQDPLIFNGAVEIGCNGIDENCSGPADDTTVDGDGDLVGCGIDVDDADPFVCGQDTDADGCDDCASGTGVDPGADGPDLDGDGLCDAGDPDDDGDGYSDEDETVSCVPPSDPLDPLSTPVDTDGDGACDTLDPDDDGDGDPDGTDCAPLDPTIFTGAVEIGCNGVDENCNGPADDTTVDADGDTVACTTDPDDGDALVCGQDADADGCDDCGGSAGPAPQNDGPDTDADGICDAGDPDDDGDGYADTDETVGCVPPSDPLDPLSTPADADGDLVCDTLDPDDDGDGDPDGTDCAPLNPLIFTGAAEVACNGVDENCNGLADDLVDGDGDTVSCATDPDDGDPLVCGLDVDGDGCDDCAGGAGPDPASDGPDLDADGLCDAGDPDDDGDGYSDLDETVNCSHPSDPRDPLSTPADADGDGQCNALDADDDGDGYSDEDETVNCSPPSDPLDPLSTPTDADGDLVCDTLDPDDDGDGDPDGTDCAPQDPLIFNGAVEIGCNGIDENCSGPADDTTVDGDGDLVGCGVDVDDTDPLRCADTDADACDDCAAGSGPDPASDGPDLDADGLCDAGDPDDDGDGYTDTDETLDCAPPSDPLDPLSTPVDTDGDGACDTLDPDDDGDGDPDGTDCAPQDPTIFTGAVEIGCNGVDENCNGPADDTTVDADGDTVACATDPDDGDALVCGRDADADGCDDCGGGVGPAPQNDGPDTDADGICDAGDPDDDGDGYADTDETVGCVPPSDPLDPLSTPADADGDLVCDTLDPDDDGDGDPDGTDCAPLDPAIFTGAAEIGCNGVDENCSGLADDVLDADGDTVDCSADPDDGDALICGLDVDGDGCDDCAAGSGPDPASDGPDLDADGLCDAGDPDDDGDGYSDLDETVNCSPPSDPLDPLSTPLDTDGDGQCDTVDIDADNDGYADEDETVNCSPPSDPLDPLSVPLDLDGDLICDTLDPDDDGDGDPDGTDCAPLNPLIFTGAVEVACNGVDENCNGPADDVVDADGDTVDCASDPDDGNPLVCGLDADADTCDDCAAGAGPEPGTDGSDLDGDGLCDAGDPDDDGDGYPDADEALNCVPPSDPLDPLSTPADLDGDLVCDTLDPDDDGDGDPDGTDCAPRDPLIFTGAVEIGCNGVDENCSGPADDTTVDADGDLVGCGNDVDDADPLRCVDTDADGCDDCAAGAGAAPASDGPDLDGDGLCDTGDPDDDGDGIPDITDNCPLAANPAQVDTDGDGVGDACEGDVAGERTIAGSAAGDRAGYAVAMGGDADGDGFEDLLVGSPGLSSGEGGIRMYRGSAFGPILSTGWTATSGQPGAELGTSVAWAGDVNGDGYDDVLAGAPYYTNGEDLEGAAFLYAGGLAGPGTAPAWSFEPDQLYADAGIAVAGAGDVNGDGFDDILVGADAFENGESSEGAAFLFLGSASGPEAAPAWTVEGNQPFAILGFVVAGAGDVNGDGFDDVLVGAPNLDAVHVYHGSADGPAVSPSWTAVGEEAGSFFGSAAASAGDVNGDGFDDVVVGAYAYGGGLGRAYLYLGSGTGLSATPAWTFEGAQASALLGIAVAGGGDVNGDGFDDVIVGAAFHSGGEANEGKLALFLGSSVGLAMSPVWEAESDLDGALLGASLSMGQVNGNGFADVAAGAWGYADPGMDQGAAYVYVDLALDGDPDADMVAGADDCDGLNPLVWDTPGEIDTIVLTHDLPSGVTTLSWQATEAGSASLAYDVILSPDAQGFASTPTCLESGALDTMAVDPATPAPGGTSYYLVRAVNACPGASGLGGAGTDSQGVPRVVDACP